MAKKPIRICIHGLSREEWSLAQEIMAKALIENWPTRSIMNYIEDQSSQTFINSLSEAVDVFEWCKPDEVKTTTKPRVNVGEINDNETISE